MMIAIDKLRPLSGILVRRQIIDIQMIRDPALASRTEKRWRFVSSSQRFAGQYHRQTNNQDGCAYPEDEFIHYRTP